MSKLSEAAKRVIALRQQLVAISLEEMTDAFDNLRAAISDAERTTMNEAMVRAVRESDHWCPTDLPIPDKWRWKADYISKAIAERSSTPPPSGWRELPKFWHTNCNGDTTELISVSDLNRLEAEVQPQAQQEPERLKAYNLIDRYLRNNLDDTDYAEYEKALDLLYAAPQPMRELTDEECIAALNPILGCVDEQYMIRAGHAIMSAMKEKNE